LVFRAGLKNGAHGIIADEDGALSTLVDSAGVFAEIGKFPCLNDAGTVAFSATLKDGGAGVFIVLGGEVIRVVDAAREFESVRGALIDDAGGIVFFATPRGGILGIYDAMARKILSMGDRLFESTVVDFALAGC